MPNRDALRAYLADVCREVVRNENVPSDFAVCIIAVPTGVDNPVTEVVTDIHLHEIPKVLRHIAADIDSGNSRNVTYPKLPQETN